MNTAVTFLLFAVLQSFIPYLYAYTLTYVIGVGISYVLSAYFVFGGGMDKRSAARFPVVYVIQYAFGAIGMWSLVDLLGIANLTALLIVTLASIPLTFVMSRIVIVGSASKTGSLW